MRYLAIFLLSGCVWIHPQMTEGDRVEGLENLRVEVYVEEDVEAWNICAKHMGIPMPFTLFAQPRGCTIINLAQNRAVVILPKSAPQDVIDEENRHAHGYWHDDALRKYRDDFRSNQERDS